MSKTRFEEKTARGGTIITETGPYREKPINGPGIKANFGKLKGGVEDISASITAGKVKKL